MEVDVRFVDMMIKRNSIVLDIGCGIGNAVNGLRTLGHDAYGVDPTTEVPDVAGDLYGHAYFRNIAAIDTTSGNLALKGLPDPMMQSSCRGTFLLS